MSTVHPRVGEPLGRPVLSDAALEGIRRRYARMYEDAALGAIFRRMLTQPLPTDCGGCVLSSAPASDKYILDVDSEVRLDKAEAELIAGLL